MAIDREKIITTVSKIPFTPNENGLITAFGTSMQQLPTTFWHHLTWQLLNHNTTDLDKLEKSLIKMAHESTYYTGYHLIISNEWNHLIAPMVEKHPEDVVKAMLAVFAAWGFGNLELIELDAFKKMVIQATHYHESEITQLGTINRPCAYMIRGVCAALMDLAYPEKHYPEALGTYKCQQTKGIEIGDAYGEFVVTKV